MRAIQGAIMGTALLLAGCGEPSSKSTSEATADGTAWGAEACRTLTAEAAAKAAGVAVSQATSNANAQVGGNTVSTCSYAAGDGTTFTVALRRSPDGTLAESIAGLKSQPDMTGPIEDVAAPAGKAFWAPRLKTLTYMPDDHRMVSVTPPGANVMGGKSDPDDVLKQRALALALAAAG